MNWRPNGKPDVPSSASNTQSTLPGMQSSVELAACADNASAQTGAVVADWGAPYLQAIMQRASQHPLLVWLWLRVRALLPILTVAVAMIGLADLRFLVQRYGTHPGLAGFADINHIAAAQYGLAPYGVPSNVGYDGQFYFFLANRPSYIWTCTRGHAFCSTYQPEFRWQRVLYPMTARLLAFGHTDLLGAALLAVNFLAILITVVLVARMAIEAGATRWLGACAGLYAGEMLGFLRDLADPYSVMWLVLAVYLFRKQAWRWGALALACALLSREALVVMTPLLLVPLLFQRRWLLLIETGLLAFGPFVAWQAILKHLYGPWPIIAGDPQAAKLAAFPFAGLLHQHRTGDFTLMVIFVAVPMCIAFAITLRAVWQRGPRHLLADPLPAFVLVYLGLISMTYWFNWADIWAPTRLAAPGLVLALVVVAGLRAPALRASYATILALSVLAPIFPLFNH